MKRITISIIILGVIITTIACSFNFSLDLPLEKLTPEAEQSYAINIPLPQDSNQVSQLELVFAAGDLEIAPGAQDALIQGVATYNVSALKPVINTPGRTIQIKTGEMEFEGFPDLNNKLKNNWELKLGQTPINLELKAGAYEGNLDFGGLNITNIEIMDGASDVDLEFSSANLGEMNVFSYKTGASSVRLRYLANANFGTMIFKAGAGDYRLDFSGSLKRDATVVIDAGMSNLAVIVPKDTNVRLFYDGGLSNVDIYGDWEKSGNDYFLYGNGPTLTININLGAGNLQLRNE